jgi:hypothetical protein
MDGAGAEKPIGGNFFSAVAWLCCWRGDEIAALYFRIGRRIRLFLLIGFIVFLVLFIWAVNVLVDSRKPARISEGT